MARIAVDERRESLIRAALRVIGSKGVNAASTRAIVAEAGASLASFHYAFSSRDQLMALVIEHVIADEETSILESLELTNDIHETVYRGLGAYLDQLIAFPLRELAVFELTWFALRTEGLEDLAAHQYRSYRELATGLLLTGAAHCGIEWRVPVDELARFVVVLTDGITTSWLGDRDDAAARRSLEFATDAVVAYAVPANQVSP